MRDSLEVDADHDEIAAPAPSNDPLALECIADRMLAAMRTGTKPLEYFEWADPAVAPADLTSDAVLSQRRPAADLLTRARMARFGDESRATLILMNAGRYWSLHGGYLAYLQQDQPHPTRHGPSPMSYAAEMEAVQAMNRRLLKLRLKTFWVSFAISSAGFVMSLTVLTLAILHRSHLLP